MTWYFAYSKSSIDGPREASDFHPAGDQKASNRILSARLSTMAAYEAERESERPPKAVRSNVRLAGTSRRVMVIPADGLGGPGL